MAENIPDVKPPPPQAVFEVPVDEAAELAKLKPADRVEALLSGLGFFKLTVQRRKQMRYILVGSLIAHALGLAVFGGWVIMRNRQEKQTQFTVPPPSRTYEPRKLEHKVKLKKQQRSSSRPSVLPRIVSLKMNDLSLPEIKVDPKLIHTTFQSKFKAVSGRGLGVGLGTGYGEDGFGDGVNTVNFFGIHARGERTAILVDVSISMVEPEKGGPEGYARVRQRIEEVVDALGEATMFNVIVFADAASQFEKDMLVASKDNKTRAKLWFRPFNKEGNYGLTDGNCPTAAAGLQGHGGTTRLDLALAAACAQGADTIMIISDGLPKVKKGWSADQMAAFNNQRAQWLAANAGAIAAYDSSAAAAQADRVWVPPTPARPPSKVPLKEGVPIDKGSPAIPGHWQVVHGGRGRPAPPPIPDPGFWTLTDFIEHMRLLHEHYNAKKGRKPPVVHCIGYMIDNDGHAFMSGLARQYKGEYRRVARLR